MGRLETIRQKIHRLLQLDGNPARIAAGFGVGVFVSFTPFFGLHTPLAVILAYLLRLNRVATITGAWVNTPLTVVPALVASHEIGRLILGTPPASLPTGHLGWRESLALLQAHGSPLILGSSLIGLVGGVIGYAVCHQMILRYRARDPGLAELTREMEETGEDLPE